MDKNPEINLPTDLDVELNIQEFPILRSSNSFGSNSSVKKNDERIVSSWVKVSSMGLETINNKNSVINDRSNMECWRPQ